MPGPAHNMGGKTSAAKKRAKNPLTAEAKRSAEQKVGRLERQKVSRPAENVQADRPKPTIAKKQQVLERDEKRLRALNKLLRQIEELQDKQVKGESLDEQQLQKVGRLDEVLEEMDELMTGG